MKKFYLLMATVVLSLSASMNVCAVALPDEPGSIETTVDADIAPAIFNVTVPSSLPFQLAGDGTVTYPERDSIKIINNSSAPVIIDTVQVTPATGWTLQSYDYMLTKMDIAKIDTKELSMMINEQKTDGTGKLYGGTGTFATLARKGVEGSELVLDYNVLIPAQSEFLTESIAMVTFILDWA